MLYFVAIRKGMITVPDTSGLEVLTHWDFFFKFISIHYQDVFKVEVGVKISGIYHRVQIYWFGARPFSLRGARVEKSCKSSQKTTKNAVFARFFHPRSS